MNAPLRVPLIPAPPHDPKSLLLAGWIGPEPMQGWRLRKLVGTQITAPQATLQLSPTPDSSRRLTEMNGTFGGLRLPPNMALGPEGDIYLLDRRSGRISRFDPCCCRFDPVPCGTKVVIAPEACRDPASLTPTPPRPRAEEPRVNGATRHIPLNHLQTPSAIAICQAGLYVADTGHGRVLVYALAGFVPRAALALPKPERDALGAPWQPSELGFDGCGNLLVLDAAHGRIDRFDPHGHWISPRIDVPGAVHLFTDCGDYPIVVIGAQHAVALAPLNQPVFFELDAGEPQTDWQTLRFDGITAGSLFDVALMAGDSALGAAQLALLPSTAWRKWASKIDPSSDGQELPIALDVGQFLRVRLAPRAGSSAPSLTVTTRAAHAVRVRMGTAGAPAILEPIDLRSERLNAQPQLDSVVPLVVDSQGRIFILCDDPCSASGSSYRAFDEYGQLQPNVTLPAWRYKRSGTALTVMLDSMIDGCPWHRVELRGAIPQGCSVEVRTTSAPLAFTDTEIDTLDDSAWCTRNVLKASDQLAHDCLILSPPGRYLWLDLILRGDGTATPCIESVVVEFPRISIRRYLPGVFGADPAGADFTDRFTAIFDATIRSIERPIDRLASYFDPLSAPSGDGDSKRDFLTWLSTWVGVSLVRDLPEDQRRWLLKRAAGLYCLRGTREGLWRQLLLLLGFDRALDRCRDLRPQTRCVPLPLNCASPPPCLPADPPPLILEHFKLRRWLHACVGRLGSESQLWGASIVNRSQLNANAQIGVTQMISTPDPLRDPFHVYAHKFSVFVPARVRDCAPLARALDQLLKREAPAHTQVDVQYVAPRFRVGQQAMVGLDSVVARTPQGVPLATTDKALSLGQGTVLTGAPNVGKAPRVGDARVGSGTVLS